MSSLCMPSYFNVAWQWKEVQSSVYKEERFGVADIMRSISTGCIFSLSRDLLGKKMLHSSH